MPVQYLVFILHFKNSHKCMVLRLLNFTFIRITAFPENDLLRIFYCSQYCTSNLVQMHLRLFHFQYFGLNAYAYILREVHIGSQIFPIFFKQIFANTVNITNVCVLEKDKYLIIILLCWLQNICI